MLNVFRCFLELIRMAPEPRWVAHRNIPVAPDAAPRPLPRSWMDTPGWLPEAPAASEDDL